MQEIDEGEKALKMYRMFKQSFVVETHDSNDLEGFNTNLQLNRDFLKLLIRSYFKDSDVKINNSDDIIIMDLNIFLKDTNKGV
jgi:hypothetical protein